MIYVDKKRFLGIDLDTEEQLVAPTSYRYGLNMRISHEISDDGAIKSIAGNTKMSFVPPTGENRTIGTFENGQRNSIIFFNWNGGGEHGIYNYNDTDKTFSLIITTSQLEFDKDNYITQIGVVDNYLYWTDGVNPIKCINMDYDYTDFDTKNINVNLHKPAPKFQPEVALTTDPDQASNLVSLDNWQFMYRYVYVDDSYSVFSPKSILAASLQPTPFDNFQNVIEVSIATNEVIPNDVVAIEWAYEKNNSGGVFIFEKDQIDGTFTGTAKFTNSGTSIAVADSVSAKLFEAIPNKAEALALAKNRILLGNLQEGQPIKTDNGTDIVLTATVLGTLTPTTLAVYRGFKSYGSYRLGIIWHDDNTSSGVQYVQTLNIPKWEKGAGTDVMNYTLSLETAGTAPAWATRFSYAISEEGTYSQYQQFRVNMLYYGYDLTDEALGRIANTTDKIFLIGNQAFILPNGFNDIVLGGAPTYLYLQMPKSIAWIPDQETYVRILADSNGNTIEKVERVVQVSAEFLIVGTFGIGKDDLQTFFDGDLFVEVFKLNTVDKPFFYESGGPYPIAELADQKTLYGDSYLLPRFDNANGDFAYNFRRLPTYKRESSSSVDTKFPDDYLSQMPGLALQKEGFSETKSPTFKQNLDVPTVLVDALGIVTPPSFASDDTSSSYSEDLTKESYSKGRPFIVLENEQEVNREETIRYSNTFVQASNINGLANFEFANEYVLPTERSAIQAIVSVKNIALAIHIREATSLYLNERFIKSADGSEQLVTTDTVIGQDRLLSGSGNFGTINPESIVEHDGKVYWWDTYNGAVLRYSNAGIFPISEYKMSSFFRSIGEMYLGTTVIGGYDPKYDEYLLTFKPINDLPGFTITFDIRKERWTSWYSFMPENYSLIGNKFFSFVNGEMWQHDTNPLYNNFYGTQYEREIKFLCNAMIEKIKVFTNVHLDQEVLSTDDTSGYEAVRLEGEGRESIITVADFISREGLFRSQIFRNNLITEGETDYKQGEQMRAKVMQLTVRTDRTDQSKLKSVNVLFHSSEYSN